MRSRSMLLGLSMALALLLATLLPATPTLAAPVPDPRIDQSEAQNPAIGTDLLLSTRLGLDYIPAVAYNPAGQFLVAWRCEEDAPGGAWVLCGQLYDGQGGP